MCILSFLPFCSGKLFSRPRLIQAPVPCIPCTSSSAPSGIIPSDVLFCFTHSWLIYHIYVRAQEFHLKNTNRTKPCSQSRVSGTTPSVPPFTVKLLEAEGFMCTLFLFLICFLFRALDSLCVVLVFPWSDHVSEAVAEAILTYLSSLAGQTGPVLWVFSVNVSHGCFSSGSSWIFP